MTATLIPRKTMRRLSAFDMKWDPIVADGVTIQHGSWVGQDADGFAVPANDAVVVLGRASCTDQVSTLGDGAVRVRIDQGIFNWVAGAGVSALAPGTIVFALDNQTVSLDPADGPVGGQLQEVDADGAWVLSGLGIPMPVDATDNT